MMNSPDRITIRSKILGVLIRDARLKSHHSLDDCAAALGISVEKLEDFEFGVKAPSLPELEILAQTLDVPLEHFWGRTLIAPKTSTSHRDPDSLIKIRHKLIGARLRKARNEAGIALEQAAVQVGMSAQELEDSEYGVRPLSLPQLEAITTVLNIPMQALTERSTASNLGDQQGSSVGVGHLSSTLIDFIAKPVNRPYLELAHRLSEMSVEKLRSIGEGILEITL